MSEQSHNLATGILTIDTNAIATNYQNIVKYCQNLNANNVVSAVVKADGYGLGMIEVSQALYAAGCRLFYVATPEEAILLRAEFDDIEICVLDGLFMGSEEVYRDHNLIPCLSSVAQLNAWAAFGNLPCILHFDTGINRLGLKLDDFLNIDSEILSGLNVHHIMSHFASADAPNDAQNDEQIEQFNSVLAKLPHVDQSFSNSAAIALNNVQNIAIESSNILRPGDALWGMKPFAEYPIALDAVVSLTARVLQISQINAGDKVGYNHYFTAKKPMRTAIIAAGYADGLFRQLSSDSLDGGYFWFEDFKLPILGKVSMDMIVVDASSVPDGSLQEGDFVEVIGENISLEMIAAWSDTISYEILINLGKRFLRKFI